MRLTRAAALVAVVCCAALPAARAQSPESVPTVQKSVEAAAKTATAFAQPEEYAGGDHHTLVVRRCPVSLRGAGENGRPLEADLLAYNDRPVGPTIRVRRGSTLRILVKNELTGVPPPVADNPQDDKPHGMYVTNLHAHGLHVSPIKDSDNIYKEIVPGERFEYVYRVPRDHPAGTFWYHPHKHGSVGYQLTNGLAGALIVEGEAGDGVVDLEDLPEVAAARERVLVFQQFALSKGNGLKPAVDPNVVYNGVTADYDLTAVNGAVMPTVHLRPGEVQRWRMVHAGREQVITLTWHDAAGDPLPGATPFNEVAVDGLTTGRIENKANDAPLDLYPGQRSDVLFKAPLARGVYYVAAERPTAAKAIRRTPPADLKRKYLLKVVVGGLKHDMPLPAATAIQKCRAFGPLPAADLTRNPELPFFFDDAKFQFHINGVSYSKQPPPAKPELGAVEDWVLKAPVRVPADPELPNNHPFHIHVNPFQVIRVKTKDGTVRKPDNLWRDTLMLFEGEEVTVRMRFADHLGKTVYHCHILDHEDQGMMRDIVIVPKGQGDGGASPLVRRAGPRLDIVDLDTSAVKMSDLDGKSVELASREPTVVVFFQGAGCEHCTEQLRNLIRVAAGQTTIIAVSSRELAGREAAAKALGMTQTDRVHVVTDPDGRAAKAFGCYDRGPRHGLCVVDPTGRVRYRYIGDTPYDDAETVLKATRAFSAPRNTR